MLIADVPAVYVGDKWAGRVPIRLIHTVAAAIFVVLGIAILVVT
jgi:putative Ca2+/H+ antiporter (TMEM165/GDT1 family)